MNFIKNKTNSINYDNILFIQGVFIDNKTDTVTPDKKRKVYDKIPIIFKDLDTWPKTTNIKCWFCTLNFEGVPWFEPQSIEPLVESTGAIITETTTKKKVSMIVKGFFCSCNCVIANILTHTKVLSDVINKTSMLLYLYEIMTGKPTTYLESSPPHTDMEQYGGSLSILEYQRVLKSLNKLNNINENINEDLVRTIEFGKFV
jgi:hypothetical protein